MKKLIYLFALLGIFTIYSCGGSGTNEAKEDTTKEKSGTVKDCDDFLTHYEEWIDDYIQLLDNYFNNPTEETVARYMEVMQEAMQWSTKWITLIDCAGDEEYEKRFEALTKKIEDKMTDLGL